LTSINGVDPVVVDTIKIRTQRPAIVETQKTKINQDKKDKNRQEKHSQHQEEYFLIDLMDAVDKLNKLLANNNIQIYFQITNENNIVKIQLINADNQNLITVVSPEKVIRLVNEFSIKGFTIDELI
jgi:uncharacterized FlaG/YvyC family protein